MNITETTIEGLKVIEFNKFQDNRGWFAESYNYNEFLKNGIDIKFIQDNQSFNLLKGTLRGLHYQDQPFSQTKLVRCLKGKIFDVAVDLRIGSPTYLNWFGIELSQDNCKSLLIPKNFAHGYITLEDNTEVIYKVDEIYNKNSEKSINYMDSQLNINWTTDVCVISDKDRNAPYLDLKEGV